MSGAGQRRRLWLAGMATAAAYLTAVLLLAPQGRWLFDGLLPLEPYRWAPHPWLPFRGAGAALSGGTLLPLTPTGSAPGSAPTGDGQAVVVFPREAFAPADGEREVQIDLRAVHPSRTPSPPDGLGIDGNAYQVEARYLPSSRPAAVRRPVTVILTYPRHAEQVLRLDGDRWTPLPTTPFPTAFKVYAESDALGTFAAAGPADRVSPAPSPAAFVAAAAGLAAAIGAWLLTNRLRRARPPATQAPEDAKAES